FFQVFLFFHLKIGLRMSFPIDGRSQLHRFAKTVIHRCSWSNTLSTCSEGKASALGRITSNCQRYCLRRREASGQSSSSGYRKK
ncbi:unnamed protein product, partial [Mycena citricolor]